MTSKLQYEIQTLKLKRDYEVKVLQMKYDMEIEQLKQQCNHKYDDGSSATTWEGMQHNGYEKCLICGK